MPSNKTGISSKTGNNSDIRLAWEEFTDTGTISSESLRPAVQQSWQKSRELGVNPGAQRAPTVFTAEELEERVNNDNLCVAGISALNKLADILNDTEHVVVLADASGRILYSVGNRQTLDRLKSINFAPGSAWSEDVVGSNGVGTALMLKRPEVIIGHEHYCQGWHPWVCYGSPIYDSSGSTLGAIDITGPVENLNKEAMGLAISVAHSIQSGLSILQFHHREKLREYGKNFFHRWPSEGVVIINEDGSIVDYNSKAIRFLGLEGSQFLDSTLWNLVPCLSKTASQSMASARSRELTIHIEREGKILQPVKVRIEPITEGNTMLGSVLILTDLSETSQKKPPKIISGSTLQSKYTFRQILGESEKIRDVIRLASAAAISPSENNVFLIGETGTGKELIAHSIHSESARAKGPFIAINCAAIPHDLVESELFGYMPGAFTGARQKGLKGKFELAHNGTLFLDEINSMPLEVQAKFLRVLDSMEITRIGGTEPIPVDARIIAAANTAIESEVEKGLFRLDLYYRLNVLEVAIPSLSERERDVIILANDFLESECKAVGREKLTLAPETEPLLTDYNWPGNVRELHNLCVRWVVAASGNTITARDLPEKISRFNLNQHTDNGGNLRLISDEAIKRTLEQTENNVSKAARILGIDRTTIHRRRKNW